MRATSGTYHYLNDALDPARLRIAAENVERALVKIGLTTFDAIACRGASGIVVASVVSAKVGKPLCVVRKAGEVSHGHAVECSFPVSAYVIVDDCISSGGTVRHITASIEREELTERPDEVKARCLAIVTYRSDGNYDPPNLPAPLIEADK